jgi:hypothetical protein
MPYNFIRYGTYALQLQVPTLCSSVGTYALPLHQVRYLRFTTLTSHFSIINAQIGNTYKLLLNVIFLKPSFIVFVLDPDPDSAFTALFFIVDPDPDSSFTALFLCVDKQLLKKGEYIRFLTYACGLPELRHHVVSKLEMWLMNPKISRPAQVSPG